MWIIFLILTSRSTRVGPFLIYLHSLVHSNYPIRYQEKPFLTSDWIVCTHERPMDWPTQSPTDWMIDWLIDWLIDVGLVRASLCKCKSSITKIHFRLLVSSGNPIDDVIVPGILMMSSPMIANFRLSVCQKFKDIGHAHWVQSTRRCTPHPIYKLSFQSRIKCASHRPCQLLIAIDLLCAKKIYTLFETRICKICNMLIPV